MREPERFAYQCAPILIALVAGCRSEPPPSTPDAGAAPAPVASVGSSASSSSDASAAPAPMPSLAGKTKLSLHQDQGGPSNIRCKGTVYEIEVDLVTNAWKYATCTATGANAADAPLVTRAGRMRADDRAQVEATYKTLARLAAPRCAKDAGLLVLTLDGADGGPERFSCSEPVGFTNGGALAVTLMKIVATP